MAKKKQTKREDGRLQGRFTFQGKRYSVYGRTKAEVEAAKHKKLTELEAGKMDHDNPTLDKYYERFTDQRRSKVKGMTIRSESFRFRACADVMIEGAGRKLGEIRIRDIKPYDIQQVQQALEASDRSTTTVNDCMAHLSHVFNAAVRDETIEKSPCRCIERVKRTEKPARQTIHRALTEDETKRFFAAAAGSYYYNAFVLMIQTGMRVGEVGALMSADVDTKRRLLHVNKTITKDELGGYVIGDTPKTDAGNREIPINDAVIKCIQDQRRLNGMVFGDRVERTLFRSPEGALMREYMINREVKRVCIRCGIEKFTCHAFRATFATRFIEQRPQDYKILSEILGHANTKITLDLYTHAMKENKIKAMQEITIAM